MENKLYDLFICVIQDGHTVYKTFTSDPGVWARVRDKAIHCADMYPISTSTDILRLSATVWSMLERCS